MKLDLIFVEDYAFQSPEGEVLTVQQYSPARLLEKQTGFQSPEGVVLTVQRKLLQICATTLLSFSPPKG